MKDHTCITIAHRISTIKNSDEILVFNNGKIIERGNYARLTELKGEFYHLERGINWWKEIKRSNYYLILYLFYSKILQ